METKKYKILLAEDDPGVSFVIEEALLVAFAKEGILDVDIICVSNGMDAVKEACDEPPIDLALMDGNMPSMNGFEAAEAIEKIPHERALPIICISTDDIPKEYKDYFVAHYKKPIDYKELISFIKKSI